VLLQHAGVNVLYDVGPASETFDAGARIVVPKLRQAGVARIDLMFISHPDTDHVGGLAGIRRVMPIGAVVIPMGFRGHPDMRAWLGYAGIRESEVIWLPNESAISIGDLRIGATARRWTEGQQDNEGSLFLRIELGTARAVLSGDAGIESELLMAGRGDWTAQVLKAGHHGSATSTSEPWLKEVSPDWVVSSCGRDNAFGHPARETLERVNAAKARIARTDREGDITFEVREGRFRRVP
jgi:competence protein ComEC